MRDADRSKIQGVVVLDWLYSTLNDALVRILSLLNSGFGVALSGAFAGALAAYFIAQRGKSKEALIDEMRNTNAAITLAFQTCNTFLNLKEQNVKPIFDTFKHQEAKYENFQNTPRVTPAVVYRMEADLRTITPIWVQADALQKIVTEKMSSTGKPLALAAVLVQTQHSLNDSIKSRNDLIEAWRVAPEPMPQDILIPKYFGLPNQDGHTDGTYPDQVVSIYSQTDDCIEFSKMLCEALIVHGEGLQSKYRRRWYWGKTPDINRPNFSEPEKRGLMPPTENYSSWTSGFRSHPDRPSIWARIQALFRSSWRQD